MVSRRIRSRKVFQPDFGAYQGLARGFVFALEPCKKGTSIVCAKLWYAPPWLKTRYEGGSLISEPEIWRKSLYRSFCGISGICLEISDPEKYFADPGTSKMTIPHATNSYSH